MPKNVPGMRWGGCIIEGWGWGVRTCRNGVGHAGVVWGGSCRGGVGWGGLCWGEWVR